MKLSKLKQVNWFLNAVEECKGNVWLESSDGNAFNLKSKLSQYLAIAALLSDHGDDLELYCQFKEDEIIFFKLFKEHPEIIQ